MCDLLGNYKLYFQDIDLNWPPFYFLKHELRNMLIDF